MTHDDEVAAMPNHANPRDIPGLLRELAAYANHTSLTRPTARLTDDGRKLIREAADEIESLREIIRAYVLDENRFNRGEGEPFGSIRTETGMRARAAIAN